MYVYIYIERERCIYILIYVQGPLIYKRIPAKHIHVAARIIKYPANKYPHIDGFIHIYITYIYIYIYILLITSRARNVLGCIFEDPGTTNLKFEIVMSRCVLFVSVVIVVEVPPNAPW